MRVDESTHLHNVYGSVANQATQRAYLSGQTHNELPLEQRVKGRAKAMQRDLLDLNPGGVEAFVRVPWFVRENDGHVDVSRHQGPREPKSLILGTAEEGIVNDVQDVHRSESHGAARSCARPTSGPRGVKDGDHHRRRRSQAAASGSALRPRSGGNVAPVLPRSSAVRPATAHGTSSAGEWIRTNRTLRRVRSCHVTRPGPQ